jgi:hypothetical protein
LFGLSETQWQRIAPLPTDVRRAKSGWMDDGDALDPFAGIGMTLPAAQKTGRLGRDIELNLRYVDTAIERWQRMAGVAVVHAETGSTFEDMKRRPAN